jgi:uncharacterized surface protein with fasciclin (FAS1) repeats
LTDAAFFAESYEYLLTNPANVTILVPNNDAVFRLKNVFPDYVKSLGNNTAKILELSSCKNFGLTLLEDRESLFNGTKDHVLPGLFNLTNLPNGSYPTLHPKKWPVRLSSNGTHFNVSSTINPAAIAERIEASNGLLFVLEQVLRL